MKKFAFLFIGFAALVTMLTYGFNFPFSENSTGLKTIQNVQSPNPLNLQSPNAMTLESFDGTTFPPTGWTATIMNGTYNWVRVTTTAHPSGYSTHSGAGMASFQCWNASSGSRARLVTPSFSLTTGQGQLSFWLFGDPGVTQPDSVGVYINTTPDTVNATFVANVHRYKTTAGWYQYTYSLPASFNGSTNYIIFKAYSLFGNDLYLDDVSFGVPGPMTYVSSTTSQITSGQNITQNSVNNPVVQVQVVTSDALTPFSMTALNFSTAGSTNPADFSNAKVYYTGTNSIFATTTLFGTVTNPNGAFSVTGTQTLAEGTNYFWLTYDATSGAVIGDTVDAQCLSIVGSGTMGSQIPTITNPNGRRQIDNYCRGTYTNNGCSGNIYITNVTIGSINNTSTCDPDVNFPYAYSWFVNQTTNLQQGVTYPISASAFSSGNTQGFAVWVDWDNNNLFDLSEYTLFPLITSGGSNTTSTTITVPPGASLGSHRMRVRNNMSSAPTSAASCSALSYGETEDYTINVVAASPMTYTSSTVTQNNITAFNSPSLNTEVIGVQVVTSGSLSPLNATSFTFNTTGSTNPATDITNAKVWYTGITNAFATTDQFGVVSNSPNGTFTVTGTKTLLAGTNYFWLTYDVPVTATSGNVIDAECTSLTVGTTQTPTVTAPAGSRTIGTNKLSGVYTIPGSYPNFTTAIADLNNKGISGPVTFNVSSGFSDTAANLQINTTGTASMPIIFQRFGTDNLLPNPVIYAGVGTSTTLDGIIKLNGADYITFDGIDLMENPANVDATTKTEWGYALLKPDGTNGSQNVTIKNCAITLNKTNLATVGIYSANHSPVNTSNITVTSTAGTASNNTFFNNTITNTYIGIGLYGFAAAAPYDFYDQNNTINQNTITNYGGSINTAYGVYDIYQNGLSITNCVINSTGGTNTTTTLYGIFCSTMHNSNLTISGNTVTIAGGGTTSQIFAINFGNNSSGTTNTVNVLNNTIQNCTYSTATSGQLVAMYCYASTYNLNITGNRIIGNTHGAVGITTGLCNGMYSIAAAINAINISNNLDSGNTVLGTTAYSQFRIYNSGAANYVTMTGNAIKNNVLGGTTSTSIITCFGNTGGNFTINMSNNTVSDNTIPSTGSQTVYLMSNGGSAPAIDFSFNTVSGNTASGTGSLYGIYVSGSPAAGSTENITNNNILNLSKTTATGTGTIYCIYKSGSGQGTININNNTVAGITSAAATTMYGIYQIGSPPNYLNFNNNKIGNLTTGGASTVYGIYNNASATTYSTYSQDSIYNLTSLGGIVYGMYTLNGAIHNLTRNTIAGLTSSTGTGGTVNGIYVSGGVTTNVYNNLISDLKAPASTSIAPAITGLYINSGTYTNAYYNTIYLNATSTSVTTFGSAGIYATTTPIVDLRNNVVVNNSTPGPTGGQTVAYRRSSNLLTSYSPNSNNNCFWAGTPSVTRLIFYDGTNSDQTLAAYKTRVNPKDNAAVTENPPFVNGTTPPYDLKIQTGVATQLESGGLVVAAPVNITNDAFGTSRYPNSGYPVGGFTPTAPDIGAHEFGGLNSASGAPYISYTALGIGGTSNRAFNNVIITDPNGINTTAGTKPRCYYKRSIDGNVINDNTSGTDGWKWVEANGTTSPFDFTINYALLNGGTGVVAGNTIQYFVIAQDLDGTPNVSWNTATFTTAPTTVALLAGNAPITLAGSYTIGTNTFSGTYNVGTGETFTSLTGATGIFAAINAGTVSGDITISITSDMTEDGVNSLNALNVTGVGGYKVRIVPASASVKTISGAVAQGMIRLNGAKKVTIDGDNGFGAKYLTFRNTNGLYPTLVFINEARLDSLKNCTFESNNASTGTTQAGTILVGTTTGLQGNDSNVIANCDIRDRSDATGYPAYGIYNSGTSTSIPQYNSNNVVTGCNIYNYFVDAATLTGGIYLNTANTDWIITGNSFYQTATRTVNMAATYSAIYNNNSANNNNNQITNNYIGGSAPLCGGTPMTYSGPGAYTFYGIQAFVNVLAPTNITGNTIKNINLSTSPVSGISTFFKAIYAQTGWINVNNNIIGAPTGNDNITLTTNFTFGSYTIAIIQHNGFGSVNNNTMGSITFNGTSTGTSDGYYGISYSNTNNGYTYSINNNLIGSLSTANSIQQTKTATGSSFRGILLSNGAGTTNNITNNTIANITDFSTSTVNTVSVYGISNSGAGNYNFAGNTVRNLTNNCNVPSSSFLLGGIFSTGSGVNTYTQNNIYSLYALGTDAGAQLVGGILCGGTQGGTASRNKIFDFKELGTGVLAPAPLLLGFNVQSSGPYTLSNNVVSLTNGDPSDAITQELLKTVKNTSNKVFVPEIEQRAPAGAKCNDGFASEQVNMENSVKAELCGVNDGNTNLKKESGKDDPLSTINCSIAGVYVSSTAPNPSNYYFNSIYIGGTQPSGSLSSWAFVRTSTGAVNLRNNLFVNARTGGLGFHYVVGNESPNVPSGWNSSASNYNVFIGNANTIGEWGPNNSQTLTQWMLSSGGDANSTSGVIPGTTLFRNVTTGDLNIDTTQYGGTYVYKRGIGITGISTDYNGYPRATSGPVNIGAHEFTLNGSLQSSLISPANGTTGLENAVRLVWTKALFAASYNLQISSDSTFATNTVNRNVPDTTTTFLASNLKYYWRVNAVYAQYSVGPLSTVFNFSTLGTPTRVTLVSPADDAIDLPVTIQFVWNKASDGTPAPNRITSGEPVDISSYFNKTAKTKSGTKDNVYAVGNYLIRLTNDTTGAIVYSDSTLTDTTTVLTGFPANQKFYWNVSAKNEFGWGATSVWFNATTIPMPGTPVAVSPPYDTTGMATTVNLVWTRSFKAATYTVEMSTDSTYGTLMFSDSLKIDSVKTVSGLSKSTKYFWRVRAVNGAGNSNWAGTRFTTANTSTPVTLVSPNNVIQQPVGGTVFKWRKLIFPGVSGYWFEVTTDTTAAPVMIDSTLLATDTSVTKGGFEYFTNYYWRVRAKNDFGWGDFSYYFKFQTEVGPPNLVYPANNSLGIIPTVTLDWDVAPGAATYRMQLSADSTFASTILNVAGLPTSQYTVPGGFLSILTNYYWRVNSTNVNETSIYSPVWKFRTMGAPVVINLVSPVNNAINVPALNTVFKWNKGQDQTLRPIGDNGKTISDGKDLNSKNTGKTGKITTGTDEPTLVSKYWFELVTDTVAMTGLVQDTTLTDTTKTIASLSNMTAYYYRVKGKNEIGWGSFSPWNKFTTTVALPALLTPANNAVDVVLSPVLDWSNVATATSYDVQVSADAGFSTLLYNVDGLPTSDYTIAVPLSVFTTYYWRVRATNANGTSPYYSSPFIFRTVPNAPLAPALLTPANNSTGLTLPVTLVWSKVLDAYSYRLQVATDAGFTALVFNDGTLTDTSKVIPGLQPVTTYYWRVNSTNTAGTSAYSSTWNFRALGVPNLVTLLSPVNGAIDQPTTLTFVWSAATEPLARPLGGKQSSDDPLTISKYYFELTRDTVTLAGIYRDSTASDTTLTAGGLLTNRDYFWRVKAQNQTGNGSFTGWNRFKTIVANPIVPVLVLPANNAVNLATTVIFQWRKVNDNVDLPTVNKTGKTETDDPLAISKYYFELTPDTVTFTGIYRDSTVAGPSDTTLTRAGLTNNTAYFWRVRARNQAGLGPFASWFKFTTIVATPIAPVLTAPANNSTGVSLTPALSWGAVTGALSYRIQVSTDSLFATSQFDTSGITAVTLTVPANKLTGLTKYYWRVNATNAGGTGPYSIVWNFRTLQNLTLNLKVYLEGFWNGTAQVSDTTTVYLANATTPYAYVDTVKVILSTTGTSAINFTKAPNGSYYIVVNHRNHLDTWSKLPQAFVTNVAVAYDFTTAANKAFGDNMKQVGTVWVLYGGDANKDGAVDALDVALFIVQFGNSGYLSCDFNGDGSVDALDVPIIVANFGLGKAVPTLDGGNGQPGNINKGKVIEEIQKKYKLNG
ncbi:MAG: GEVED domain-containing protein, partial [Ignavibacteriae bacterium]|nr:GEVED domain-containing protein [Ignavibacteriota bacterium]